MPRDPYPKIETDILKSVFQKAGSKISHMFLDALKRPSIDQRYWTEQLEQIKGAYSLLQDFWIRFVKKQVPDHFDEASEVVAKKIGRSGIEFSFTEIDKQALRVIAQNMTADITDSISDAQKSIEYVFRETKQTILSEKQINRSLSNSLESGSTPGQISNSLKDEIIKKMGSEQKILVSGKRYYDPDSYAEIVTRTRLREAQTAGAVSTMKGFGLDLIQFSSHGSKTEICIEHGAESDRVFSLTGNSPYPVASSLTPFHPNCQHVVVPYVAYG